MAGAHAALPTSPCGYECLWPIGSYEVPDSMRVGEVTVVEYTYAWEEAPGNGAVGTLAQRELPPGRHAWPEEWGEPVRPDGYAGSAVTLMLPEGVDVVGWERRGLERSEAWTDHYGRTTYMYAGLNAYAEGVSVSSIELAVEPDAVIYPDDEVWIDLGVRGTELRSPVAWLNRAGDAVRVSAEPAGAAGSGGDPFPHRDIHVLPESALARLDAESLGAEAKRAMVELLLEQADAGVPLGESDVPGFARAQVMARVGKEASGGAGEEGVVYAYGRVMAHKRSSGLAGVELAASPAAGIKACAYDRGPAAVVELTHNGAPACAVTDANGFYVIVVPRNDPDGDGTSVDIIPLFFLEGEQARALSSRGNVLSAAGRLVSDVSAAAVSLGEYTLPPLSGTSKLISRAYLAYDDVLEAHGYFSEEVGYDAPLVRIMFEEPSGFYVASTSTITLSVGPPSDVAKERDVVLHEYGHHIMNRVYGGGIPSARNCSPHTPDRQSSPTCAWTEGWASFVHAVVDDTPVFMPYGTTDYYWETHKSHARSSGVPDPRTGSTFVRDYYLGEDGEGSVTAILWDMHDGFGEPGDDVSASMRDMWTAFASDREEDEAWPAVDIRDFYDDWSDRGGQNLDSVFAINGVEVTHDFLPPSLALSVERAGVTRSGDYAAHAKGDDTVVTRLDLGRAASAGTTPTASFFGEVVPMSPVGDGRREWTSRATVPGGAPGGAASVTVHATGPGLEAAGSQAVVHSDGSDTVTLHLASVPVDGEYAVTARASVADLGGTALGSDQSLAVGWSAAGPVIDTATISPDGREVTLSVSKEIDEVDVPCVRTLEGTEIAADPLHVRGSSVVKLHLASAPAIDTLLGLCGSAIDDAQGRSVKTGILNLPWNPEAPAFEHVTVSPDGRILTLAFSEKARVWLGLAANMVSIPPTDGLTLSATHTFRLAQALDPGTHAVRAPALYTDGSLNTGRRPVLSEMHTFTYNPSGPTFDHVKISPDGMTLTLTFSEAMDGASVTGGRFTLGGGLALAGGSPIAHNNEAHTVSLSLASAPASDGTYLVTAKSALRSSAGAKLGSDQTRTFTWNPEAPELEHVEVSADGRTLTLTFSEGLHSNTLSPGTIQVSPGLDYRELGYRHGSDKVTLTLGGAPPAGTHHVYVSREVADVAGRQMAVNQERSFAWDASPPSFESVEASADGRTLTLTFSEGLDARTVTTCGVARSGGVQRGPQGIHGHGGLRVDRRGKCRAGGDAAGRGKRGRDGGHGGAAPA